MPYVVVLVHEIPLDDLVGDIPVPKFREIGDLHRFLVFLGRIFLDQLRSDRCGIHEYVIDLALSDVFLDDIHEILHLEIVRLPVLGHDIADIDDLRVGVVDRLPYPF